MDLASEFGIERQSQDFGLTLARWGVPSGPYLVLPFLGPRTLRDVSDDIVLAYQAPIIHIIRDWRTRTILAYTSLLDLRARLLDAEGALEGAIIDDYQQVRDAYVQRREYIASGGKIDYGDDYLDEGDDGVSLEVSAEAPKAEAQESKQDDLPSPEKADKAPTDERAGQAEPVSPVPVSTESVAESEDSSEGEKHPQYPVGNIFIIR